MKEIKEFILCVIGFFLSELGYENTLGLDWKGADNYE